MSALQAALIGVVAALSVLEGGWLGAAVREAVLRSAVECYTLEGAYPESLEYLEKHYGLTVNKKEYIVTYEVFADNQLPTVQVLVRGEE